MADDDLDIGKGDIAESGAKKKNPVGAIILLIAAVAIMVFVLFSNDPEDRKDKSDGTSQYDPKKAKESQIKDSEAKQEAEKILELDNSASQGPLVTLQVEMEDLSARMDKQTKQHENALNQVQSQMRRMENKFEQQLQEMSSILTEFSQGRVDQTHLGTTTATGEDDYPVLTDENGKPIDPDKQKKNEFYYRSFRPTRTSNSSFDAQTGVGGGNPLLPNFPEDKKEQPGKSSNKDKTSSSDNDAKDDTEEKKSGLEKHTIPALSFVRVTNLHGVNCPVSGEEPGRAQGLLKSVPVFLPIIGTFQGPNGVNYDIGHANLLGFCTGLQIGKTYRARISITDLSYVDSEGVSHHLDDMHGYTIDLRDNMQDIQGYVQSVKGRKLAKASFAAGISAASKVTTQSAFTTTRSTDNGSVTSTLDDGEIGRAVGGAMFDESADLLAEQWLAEAEKSFDVVTIPAGIKFDFYSINPISVLLPPTGDELYVEADPLI